MTQIKWPYALLLLILTALITAVYCSPYINMSNLKLAIDQNDNQRFSRLVNTAQINDYTSQLLNGMIKIKYNMDMENPAIDPRDAMQDYTFARTHIKTRLKKLTSPGKFNELICGNVIETGEHDSNEDCGSLNGKLEWLSLTQAKIDFKNPATRWSSSLILDRTGLFNWQISEIQLPVNDILQQFEKQILAAQQPNVDKKV